jgi:glycosyltransferase involved in cell wall biosynthesis
VKQHKFISVVIRCHNAQQRIPSFLATVDNHFNERFDAYEIVVVDDASSDRSTEAVKAVAPTLHCALSLVELAHFHGIEAAMVAGLDRAMGDFVFEFDDTFTDYPFEVLDRMYESAVSGFDVVAAAPSNLGWGLRAFYAVCNWFSGIQPPLSYERLRVSSRRALDAMLHQRERIRDRQVLYRYTGYRYLRLEYPADRSAGHRPTTSLRFGLDVFFSFTDAGVRISRALFLFFTAVSALSIVASIIAFVSDKETPWELVITAILAVGFAGLYFVLAVVGEYAARILAEVRSRPIYTMDKTLTWTITPTETQRVPSGIPTQERVEAPVDVEPFMVRQRRESAEYLSEKRTERSAAPGPLNRPGNP